jgi:ankyrin repeat protein
MQQILRELAIGIFCHDTVPFFSLHFNADGNLYPVIPPVYQNTLVGHVISMLDYYMKGFLNGFYYPEAFVQQWQQDRNQSPGHLLPHLVDLHQYCCDHLGMQQEYYTVREFLNRFETTQKEPAGEAGLLSDYSAFRSSFRIIAKQNGIKQWENLFVLDGDFDVLYTISPTPAYEDELRRYRQHYGHDPVGYQRLEYAYQEMAKQIKTLMPKLSPFKELFEMLKVINFFSYYYKTLKSANRIPKLDLNKRLTTSYPTPTLFPHIPLSKKVKGDLKVNCRDAYERLSEAERTYIGLALFNPDSAEFAAIQSTFSTSSPAGPSPTELSSSVPIPPFLIFARALQQCAVTSSTFTLPHKYKDPAHYLKVCKETLEAMQRRFKPRAAEIRELLQQCDKKIEALELSLDSLREKSQRQDENLTATSRELSEARDLLKNLSLRLDNLHPATPEQGRSAVYLNKRSQIQQEINRAKERIASLEEVQAHKDKKPPSEDLEKARNLIQKELSKKLLLEKELEELLPLAFSKYIWKESVDDEAFEFYKEQSDIERYQSKQIVGGCGVNLSNMPPKLEPTGRHLLDKAFPTLVNISTEELAPYFRPSKNPTTAQENAEGYLLKLEFEEYIALDDQEYRWFETRLDPSPLSESNDLSELLEAAHDGEFEFFSSRLNELASKQIDLSLPDSSGMTLAHHAATLSSSSFIQELARRGLNLESKDRQGLTPLHHAARSGSTAAISFLLQHAPSLINRQALEGETALYMAVQANQLDCVKLLLSLGSQVNLPSLHGMTPLYSAMMHGYESIVMALLEAPGIGVNLGLEDGMTPIFLAVEMNRIHLLEALHAKGGEIGRPRLDGFYPIHLAAKSGSYQFCKKLLSLPGVDLNVPLPSGRTALHLALEYNTPEVVMLLLEHGAAVDRFGWERETPLLLAVRYNLRDLIEELAESSLGKTTLYEGKQVQIIDLPDIQGHTPLSLALQMNNSSLVIYLMGLNVSLNSAPEMLRRFARTKLAGGWLETYISEQVQLKNLTRAHLFEGCLEASALGNKGMSQIIRDRYDLSFKELVAHRDEKGWGILHHGARHDDLHLLETYLSTAASALDLLYYTQKDRLSLASIAARYGSLRVLKRLLPLLQSSPNPEWETQYGRKHLLLAAIESGDREIMEQIITTIFWPDQPLNHIKQHPSHIAAIQGDCEMIDLLKRRGCKMELRDKDKRTAFHYAIMYDWQDLLEYLIRPINRLTLPNDLPFSAAAYGSTKAIDLMVPRYSDSFIPFLERESSGTRETPLFKAIHMNNVETFLALLKHGANVHARTSTQMTPLLLAAQKGRYPLVQHLLAHDITSGEARDGEGNTALHWAILSRSEELVSYLVEVGFNPKVANLKGKTPLSLVQEAKEYHLELILQGRTAELEELKSQLIEAILEDRRKGVVSLVRRLSLNSSMRFDTPFGALCLSPLLLVYLLVKSSVLENTLLQALFEETAIDYQSRDAEGNGLLHYMAIRGDILTPEVLERFPKLSLADTNHAGQTPLHYYATQPTPGALKKVLELTKEIDPTDKKGFTPLFHAIEKGLNDTVTLLIEKGANPNHYSKKRFTPLAKAIMDEKLLTVDLLLKGGAQPDLSLSDSNDTSLHLAVEKGSFEMVKSLLMAGANPNHRNILGITPTLLAIRENNLRLVKLLTAFSGRYELDNQGNSVYHLAAAKAQLNPTAYGLTQLQHAIVLNHESLFKELVNLGVRIAPTILVQNPPQLGTELQLILKHERTQMLKHLCAIASNPALTASLKDQEAYCSYTIQQLHYLYLHTSRIEHHYMEILRAYQDINSLSRQETSQMKEGEQSKKISEITSRLTKTDARASKTRQRSTQHPLYSALHKGDSSLVYLLVKKLKQKAVGSIPENAQSMLRRAVSEGDLSLLVEALTQGYYPDSAEEKVYLTNLASGPNGEAMRRYLSLLEIDADAQGQAKAS